RESHRAPSELVESMANEYTPSWAMARPRSASYHRPLDAAPNEPSWGPSMVGRAFHVIDSFHAFDEIEKTRPPAGDESIWYRRSRTSSTIRPVSPLTSNWKNDCLAGLESTHMLASEPKLVSAW